MALTGLQIYKLLPQTNCKDCGFPTCLAFAMKLAAKQAELAACAHVGEEAKAQLESAATPPIRLITLSHNGTKLESGNETVLFRHEKSFYHQPGLFVRVRDSQPLDEVSRLATQIADYAVDYVGLELRLDGMAVECDSGDVDRFRACVEQVNRITGRPLILIGAQPALLEAGLAAAAGSVPLLYAADGDNWAAMAELARKAGAPLAVRSRSGLAELAHLVEQIKGKGVVDLVLALEGQGCAASLATMTQIRRLALKKNLRTLGFPILTFPGADGTDDGLASARAAQHIAKYGGLIVLERFDPAQAYALLVLRQNIFTDPQKPIQVQPGLYGLNEPDADAPLMVTTNFSITYFSVANEVEGSGTPGWLLVADAEGMSVLTAWAAGKFDATTIAQAVRATGVDQKLNHRRLIIPGQVAVLSGDLEEELPEWQILVGPREAVDLPGYLRISEKSRSQ